MNSQMEVSQQGIESLLFEANEAYAETEKVDHFDPVAELSDEIMEEYAAQLGVIDDVFEIVHRLEQGECERTESILALIEEVRSKLVVLHQRANMIRMILQDGGQTEAAAVVVPDKPKNPKPLSEGAVAELNDMPKDSMPLFSVRFKQATLTA